MNIDTAGEKKTDGKKQLISFVVNTAAVAWLAYRTAQPCRR